jgi:hypothetical protein
LTGISRDSIKKIPAKNMEGDIKKGFLLAKMRPKPSENPHSIDTANVLSLVYSQKYSSNSQSFPYLVQPALAKL